MSDDRPPYGQVERAWASSKIARPNSKHLYLSQVVRNLDKDFEANLFDNHFESVPACSHNESSPCIGIATSSASSHALARLDALATTCSGGVLTHRYQSEVILQALELKVALKPQVSLGEFFTLVATCLFDEGSSVFTAHAMSQVNLPSYAVLLDCWIRLDSLRMLWERSVFNDFFHWRYLNPDSPPQLGWQWLLVREDWFGFPKDEYPSEEAAFAQADFDSCFEARTCHLSMFAAKAVSYTSVVQSTIFIRWSLKTQKCTKTW